MRNNVSNPVTQALTRLMLHAFLAWVWEYGFRNSLITQTSNYVDYVFALFIILASTSEFIAMVSYGLHPYKAVMASFIFALGWVFFRHILVINILWSFALTYMTWASPSPLHNPMGKEYVMAALLTFLATAGVEVTKTHWVGVTIRMIPLLTNFAI